MDIKPIFIDLEYQIKRHKQQQISQGAIEALERYSNLGRSNQTTFQSESQKLYKNANTQLSTKKQQDNYTKINYIALTEQQKLDLEAIKYKQTNYKQYTQNKEDLDLDPQNIAFGIVKEGSSQWYSQRIPRKQRSKTLTEQLFQNKDEKTIQKIEEIRNKQQKLKRNRQYAQSIKRKHQKVK